MMSDLDDDAVRGKGCAGCGICWRREGGRERDPAEIGEELGVQLDFRAHVHRGMEKVSR